MTEIQAGTGGFELWGQVGRLYFAFEVFLLVPLPFLFPQFQMRLHGPISCVAQIL